MNTYNFQTKEEMSNTLVTFHIGRGGRFYNSGHKTFQDSGKSIMDYIYSNDCQFYIHDEDENGVEIPSNEQTLIDAHGNELMDAEDLKTARETGCGTLNIDNDYDTTYTCFLKDVDDDEFYLLPADLKKEYLFAINELNSEKLDKVSDDKLNELFDVTEEKWLDELIEDEN